MECLSAECFIKIKESYQALLQLTRDSLEEKLDFEIKSGILGYEKQLESFSFFFRLNLGQKLYAHTYNLSRTLKQEKVFAVKGKELADLIVKTLQAMRNDRDINLFYKIVKTSASIIKDISMPRYRESISAPIIPSYSILKATQVLMGKFTIQKLPSIILNRCIWKRLMLLLTQSRTGLNNQDSKCLVKLAAALKFLRKDSVVDEIETLQANFIGDYDPNSQMAELEILPVICGESQH